MSARAAWRLETLGFDKVYRYVAGKVDWAAAGLKVEGELAGVPRVGEIARRDVPRCGLGDRVGDIRARLDGSQWDVCVVVNQQNVVLGMLRRKALESAEADAPAEDVMDPGPVTYRPDTLVEEAMHHMQGHGQEHPRRVERVLVTSADGELIGVLFLKDAENLASKQELAHSGAGAHG